MGADDGSGGGRLARGADTRDRLLDATRQVICETGIAGASARTIASRAQVNQALVFYHFGTVAELVEAASNLAVDRAVAHYGEAFAIAASLDDLIAIARDLQQREREIGNVAFMAQILSGAGHDAVLARAAHYATTTWAAEVRGALDRVLAGSPLVEILDVEGLAHLVTAGFVGIELYERADQPGAEAALATIASLAHLIDHLGSLGPVARRVVRTAIQRHPE